MFLLLPFLLLTTSVNKLVGLELSLAAEGGAIPPPTRGALEELTVRIEGADLSVVAALRRTDVRSQTGDTERREIAVPAVGSALDLEGLQGALRELKSLDPERVRATVTPDDGVDARRVVLVMDAVRSDAAGELFPEVVLGAAPAAAGPAEAPADAPAGDPEPSP